jgi:hypothetical protein
MAGSAAVAAMAAMAVMLAVTVATVAGQQQIPTGPTVNGLPTWYNLAKSGTLGNSSAPCAAPVLNQGMCGSCYAFSSSLIYAGTTCMTTAAADSLLELSPQYTLGVQHEANIVQNTGDYAGQSPCNGGWPEYTLNLLLAESQVATCDSKCQTGCLPYVEATCTVDSNGVESNCHTYSTSCQSGAAPRPAPANAMGVYYLGGSWDATLGPLKAVVKQWLVAFGPVGICIDACTDFMNYFMDYPTDYSDYSTYWRQQGRTPNPVIPFYGKCTDDPNHAVTIVGWYDVVVDNSSDTYWIVQNRSVNSAVPRVLCCVVLCYCVVWSE